MAEAFPVLSAALLRVYQGQGDVQAVFLALATCTQGVNALVRGKTKEYIRFASREAAKSIAPNTAVRAKWDNMDYILHGKKLSNGLTAIILTSAAYSPRIAQVRIGTLLSTVAGGLPASWMRATEDCLDIKGEGGLVPLKDFLEAMQNPSNVDKLSEMRQEMEDTKDIVYQNLEKLLERGNKLEDVLKRSDDLSGAAKMFALEAKKANRCRFCTVM